MNTIAIDSGGTKIVGAIVDEQGNIIDRVRHKNEEHSGDYIVNTCKEIISQYMSKYQVQAVGLGVNGRIDSDRGVVMDCTRYDNWEGRHIKEELEQLAGIPVSLNNDCYSAIYGEIWMGAAKNAQSVAGFIIGTGFGGGVYDGGRFIHGASFGAGEFGHQILHRDGLSCFCGQRGCVEKYVSGTGLWEAYNRKIGEEKIHSGYEFFDLLHAGDKSAAEILAAFVEDFATVMVNVANVLNPQVFLIGGGLADTRADWQAPLQKRFRELTGPFLKNTKIVYAERGNDAALLGAAKYALDLLA
ncbi:MAG: ROK family protein [Oscillospiraceae bacterium]